MIIMPQQDASRQVIEGDMQTMAVSRLPGTARAIGRSLHIYYGDPERARAMDVLHAGFIAQGDLVFDIGAHVGDRVASFRRLGARVVALEPQPGAMRALRLIHGRDADVTLLRAAAGPQPGEVTLHVNSANPTVSTASSEFLEAAAGAPGWEGQSWDHRITVPLVNLDGLIAQHGLPAFTKIDVEGFEASVLAGLSQPLPALSFEFTTIQRGIVRDCLAQLARLGDYTFDFALGESQTLTGRWQDADSLVAVIEALPMHANSGDIYARLQK
jgi:FkbM family methyltransferase